MKNYIATLAFCIGVSGGIADAAPLLPPDTVDITSLWSLQVASGETLPASLRITCVPNATSIANGCSDTMTVNHTVSFPASGSDTSIRTGGLILTNTGSTPFNGSLDLTFGFSSFNPGGNPAGIRVTNLSEQGGFDTLIKTSGPSPLPSRLDEKACFYPFPSSANIGNVLYSPGGSGDLAECGVNSPDESFVTFGVQSIPAFGSEIWEFTLATSWGLNAPVPPIPEPPTLGLLGTATIGLLALRRRRR